MIGPCVTPGSGIRNQESASVRQDDTVHSPEHVVSRRLSHVPGRLAEGRHQVRRTLRRDAGRIPQDRQHRTAKRVLSDLGLTPVSAAAVLPDVWIPGDARVASLETWRRRCEQFATIGLQKIGDLTRSREIAHVWRESPRCVAAHEPRPGSLSSTRQTGQAA
jgi:hypothetical protein